MIRKNQAFLNRVNIILDMILVILSYMLVFWLRPVFPDWYRGNMAEIGSDTLLQAFAYSLAVFFMLSMFGFYNTTRTRKLIWKIRTIFLSAVLAVLTVSALLFIFRLADISTGILLAFFAMILFFLIAKYAFMRLILGYFRGKGYNLKHVIVIGTGALAQQYQRDIRAANGLGFHIHGFVGNESLLGSEGRWLGGFEQLDNALSSPEISEAVIALEPEEFSKLRQIISACERNGVKYAVIPFYNDIIPANPTVEVIGHSRLINMRSNRLENLGWAMFKRTIDLTVSILGLIVLSPLLLAIAVGVKCSSPGPILFRQTRVGWHRREFEMLKFRSMKQNDEENTAWTRDRDDRRTKLGCILRHWSLDELPQLINVLKGEMSIVGPRPELPHFVEQFKKTIPFYMVKHQVKPGMTGWAQVNGYRGDTSIDKRVELDIWYIDNWSPGLDIKIILKTIFGGIANSETIQ